MANSALVFNREKLPNNDMDPNINMVSIPKPTRERSKRIEAYAVVDNNFDKMLPYSCDFDHIYASNLKDSNGNCKTSELKQLKELLVLHLDLIQQQSDQLQTKDKMIASLKEENEMLKLRLQRNDRRMTLKRSKDSPESSDLKVDSQFPCKDSRNESSCNSDFSKTSLKMGGNSFLSKKNVLLLESDTNCMLNSTVIASGTVKDGLYSNKLPLSEINVLSSVQDMEGFELMNISEGSTASTYLNGSVSHSKLSSSKKIGRLKRSSRESNISRHSNSIVKNDLKMNLPSSQVGISKLNKNDENHASPFDSGSTIPNKKHNHSRKSDDDDCSCDEMIDNSDLMTTDVPYYTITGCPTSDILNEKDIAYNSLEIPSWRHKIFTSCYSMEGTENLSDDVFEKRHARLEAEEKRRKRWDVQRIREQRQLDHLRENERKRNWLTKSDEDNEKETSRPCSLYPTISGITRISIDDSLPINALGVLLKKIEPCEFSLPWKEGKIDGNGFSFDVDSIPSKHRRK